ncbi:MAG: hypothetical protein R3C05_27975 [Pirellulaceae bacterium]
MTGSSALISWGVDSIVEANSAAFMIWQLNGVAKGVMSERSVNERIALSVCRLHSIAYVCSPCICYEAISKFISQETSSMSWWGIGILLVSLVIRPMAWAVSLWQEDRFGDSEI